MFGSSLGFGGGYPCLARQPNDTLHSITQLGCQFLILGSSQSGLYWRKQYREGGGDEAEDGEVIEAIDSHDDLLDNFFFSMFGCVWTSSKESSPNMVDVKRWPGSKLPSKLTLNMAIHGHSHAWRDLWSRLVYKNKLLHKWVSPNMIRRTSTIFRVVLLENPPNTIDGASREGSTHNTFVQISSVKNSQR